MVLPSANLEDLTPYLDQLSKEQLEILYSELGDYDEPPVHIEEFLHSERFLGNYFQGNLYGHWEKVLKEIYPSPYFSDYWLIGLRGAIGIGKTNIACVGSLYDLYKMICLSNPQGQFGLVPSTRILLAILNVTMTLATDVVWGTASSMMVQSPFFSRILNPKNKRHQKGESLFPKNLDVFIGSRVSHTLGRAVANALIDEANFEIVAGQVYDTFNSLIRRMESRFMGEDGGIPGKVWIVSSETDKFSAVNKILDSYRGKKGVYVSQASLWEVKPSRYSGQRFWVFQGSDTNPAEIINPESKFLKTDPELCLEVPVEHRDAFEADISAALRDLGGRAVTASYKLFRLKDRLHKAMVVSPLFPETIQLDFDDDMDQIANYLIHKKYFELAFNRNIPRHIHVDIGVSGDRLGIASSYISGYRQRVYRDPVTFQEVNEEVPDVTNEWCLGVEAKPGSRIPIYKVRIFIQWLQRQRYLIGGVTFDGYQSEDSTQLLSKAGIEASIISLDKTSIPYTTFRNWVYEGRAFLSKSKLLLRECEELEVSTDGNKVDHPSTNLDGTRGSKDVSDAVCGSVFQAINLAHKFKHLHLVNKDVVQAGMSSELQELFWGSMKG